MYIQKKMYLCTKIAEVMKKSILLYVLLPVLGMVCSLQVYGDELE